MFEHIIFIFFIFFFLISTIGFGEIFSRIFKEELLDYSIGYKGLFGFFFICLLSLFSSYFFAHNFLHNILFHCFGIIGFIFFLYNKKNNSKEIIYLALLTLVFLIGSYVYKSHDDFGYYHLTYALNLTENKFIIGTGNFSHGFRTFSSIFYYNSILYLPLIKFYLFHIGPLFILIFFNYIIISDLFISHKKSDINFLFYFRLLSLVFINIVFYRISEHGTDRSAQILLILIFINFFELIFSSKKNLNKISQINLLLIIIFLASSMKAIYYMYLLLVPIILIKSRFFLKYLKLYNIKMILILTLSLSGNLITNYFNTGCFLYPSVTTCVVEQSWSIPKKEVQTLKTHYEWWSKAGGGANYKSEMDSEVYIKNFNWLENWIKRHFFNKVSDTLYGIIFICLVIYFSFYSFSKKDKIPPKLNYNQLSLSIILPIIFLLEWFINHPSMRYGGYVLVALPFLITTSFLCEKLSIKKKNFFLLALIFVVISFSLFFTRNIIRINKEIKFYQYDIISTPYFYVEKVKSQKIIDQGNIKIYTPLNNKMCWASKTPCSYRKDLKIDKFLGLNVINRK